jgi:TRAP-type C4-dicarboxylate transport system permease small subunit
LRTLVKLYDTGALVCFCAMTGCVLLEVVARNLVHVPTTWAEEASRLFCVWTVFLGSASAWFRGSHIVIDVLPRRVGGRAHLVLRLVLDTLSGFFILSVWYGTLMIMFISYPSTTTALEISISYFYLGLFLGATGIILFQTLTMVRTVSRLRRYPPLSED